MTGLGSVLGHRVVVCAGSGGVGKTTTAAAIGLHAARQGKKAVVLTIDPALRLADALGLAGLEPGREVLVRQEGEGSLVALMLDAKGAWDALVERFTPNPEVRDRILANRFYRHLSESFAGSQEYMAIEQLCSLRQSGRFDLIVVDTPPSQHALDFLEAPDRLARFLDRKIVRWFVRPYVAAGWSAFRVANRTARFVLERLEEATGVSVLLEISEFFTGMAGLFEGFQERVERAYELFRARETAFVLVTSAEEPVLCQAEYLHGRMRELSIPLRAVVFNRIHREFDTGPLRGAGEQTLRELVGPESAARLLRNFDDYERLARGEGVRMDAFRRQLGRRVAVAIVPNFETDVHDLGGLERMAGFLFPS